jgi:hypothetical protein
MNDTQVIRTDIVNRYKSGDELRKAKCPYCKKVNYVTFYNGNYNGDMCKHVTIKDRYHLQFDKSGWKSKKKQCLQPGLFEEPVR